jgi:UDP-2,4-diacetamido-2,4,6-trideoxy-beta-L-altropyranose hydrolase
MCSNLRTSVLTKPTARAEWVLRVASRPEFGGGHVMRCLALARALEPFATVRFALDPGGEEWAGMLASSGFHVVIDDQADDTPVAGVVLDHYEPSASMVAHWRRCAGKLVVLRDGDQRVAGADLEIRQWDRIDDPTDTQLSGLDYALVDPAFAQIPDAVMEPWPICVLVAFGHRDSPDATSRVLTALHALEPQWSPKVTVALGANASNLPRVREMLSAWGERGRLLLSVPSLRDALAGCDFAVGAGGVTAAERAAAGRPSLTVTLNGGQRGVAQVLAAAGTTVDCGPIDAISDRELARSMRELAGDIDRRAAMAAAGRRAVDGRGPQRIASELLRRMAG